MPFCSLATRPRPALAGGVHARRRRPLESPPLPSKKQVRGGENTLIYRNVFTEQYQK